MIELQDTKIMVGSTVKVVLNEDVRKHSDAVVVEGLVGTVMREHVSNKGLYAVEFDEYTSGHGCGGHCRKPHGWWVNECNLEVIG